MNIKPAPKEVEMIMDAIIECVQHAAETGDTDMPLRLSLIQDAIEALIPVKTAFNKDEAAWLVPKAKRD